MDKMDKVNETDNSTTVEVLAIDRVANLQKKEEHRTIENTSGKMNRKKNVLGV